MQFISCLCLRMTNALRLGAKLAVFILAAAVVQASPVSMCTIGDVINSTQYIREDSVANNCSYIDGSAVDVLSGTNSLTVSGGTVEGGQLKFNFTSTSPVECRISNVRFGSDTKRGGLYFRGQLVDGSILSVTGCTFENVIDATHDGESAAIGCFLLKAHYSTIIIDHNAFDSQAVGDDNQLNAITLVSGTFNQTDFIFTHNFMNFTATDDQDGVSVARTRAFFFFGNSIGANLTIRRNIMLTSGPVSFGPEGFMYTAAYRPTVELNYSGFSPLELRRKFEKGFFTFEHNELRAVGNAVGLTDLKGMDLTVHNNTITSDIDEQFIVYETYTELPMTLRITDNTLLTKQNEAALRIKTMKITSHSSYTIENNVFMIASATNIKPLLVFAEKTALASDDIWLSFSNNTVRAVNETLIIQNPTARYLFGFSVTDGNGPDVSAGLLVCNNTVFGFPLSANGAVDLVTDRGGRSVSEALNILPQAQCPQYRLVVRVSSAPRRFIDVHYTLLLVIVVVTSVALL